MVGSEARPPDGDPSGAFTRLSSIYGPEGSARSAGTFHVDFGTSVTLGGPGSSVIRLGASVINLTFGPVAPDVPVQPGELMQPNGTYLPGGVQYKRSFTLPAIPSVTARIEF